MNLQIAIIEAVKIKPKFDEPCNNCGWCCLTEVCPVGADIVGTQIPCKLLISKEGKHYCPLAGNPEIDKIMGMGTGCDAKTQMEVITDFNRRQ